MCTTPCPSHILTCHHPINLLLFGEESRLWKFSVMNILIMKFPHLLVLCPNILLSNLFCNTFYLLDVPPLMWETKFRIHNITGKKL
jgi:hypothetical protein